MGNNPCKTMGVAGKTIGSKELRALWQKYDKNKDGRLSKAEALVFFRDFAKALGGEVSEEDAGKTFDDMAGGKGYLTAEEFVFVFFSAQELVADGSQINLTESMQLARAAGPGSLSKGGDSSSDASDEEADDEAAPPTFLRLGKFLVEEPLPDVRADWENSHFQEKMVCDK
eukprot:CAMPEP_0177645464 /NCGR_PEP_ID=MMETSP0447-20121125/9261_1 /TAXON_ID=0 /ORGANISM="Stygamoeba regulata, Strain BSH-02190019" /LENGTH=170 /DNA_ID=CAMNT_0019147945 /DNA_START=195 /DNA_END=707 /DNA_ORIENTATION=+